MKKFVQFNLASQNSNCEEDFLTVRNNFPTRLSFYKKKNKQLQKLHKSNLTQPTTLMSMSGGQDSVICFYLLYIRILESS